MFLKCTNISISWLFLICTKLLYDVCTATVQARASTWFFQNLNVSQDDARAFRTLSKIRTRLRKRTENIRRRAARTRNLCVSQLLQDLRLLLRFFLHARHRFREHSQLLFVSFFEGH